MREVEAYYDGSTPVSHCDTDGIVATSATCKLLNPAGDVIGTYTVTRPALDTTTQTGTTALQLVLASAAGLVVGDLIAIVHDSVKQLAKIARINGTTVTLAVALTFTPDNGTHVLALRMSATITAPGVAAIGINRRLVWEYSDGTDNRRVADAVTVVRFPWICPIDAADVADVLAQSFQESRSPEFLRGIVARVNGYMRTWIAQIGKRPELYLTQAMFQYAADKCIRYALAEEGFIKGQSAADWLQTTRYQFEDAMRAACNSATNYDENSDGGLSDQEQKPQFVSVDMVR